jgi:hypothetical protein
MGMIVVESRPNIVQQLQAILYGKLPQFFQARPVHALLLASSK